MSRRRATDRSHHSKKSGKYPENQVANYRVHLTCFAIAVHFAPEFPFRSMTARFAPPFPRLAFFFFQKFPRPTREDSRDALDRDHVGFEGDLADRHATPPAAPVSRAGTGLAVFFFS